MNPDAKRALAEALDNLPPATRSALKAHRFDEEWLQAQRELSLSGQRLNTVQGTIQNLSPSDIQHLPKRGSAQWNDLVAIGEEALRKGQCALAVLAGGMATRMGGVIKALVPATEGKSFLELRLAEQATLGERYGTTPPLWLMTSYATHDGIADALGDRLESPHLALFRQGLSVRLDQEGCIFRSATGDASLYAPGHGDFPDCLRQSGLLSDFLEKGGRYLMVTNLDNLGGGLEPALIGLHLSQKNAVSCEVVDKVGADRGGIPVRLDGRPVILEEFRIPSTFDPQTVSVFNVNTFAFNAQALLDLQMDWTYFEVRKQVEGRTAIQYERLINEVTFQLDTNYIRVPREGEESRFLPVKDHDELARRQSDLKALAISSGMIRS